MLSGRHLIVALGLPLLAACTPSLAEPDLITPYPTEATSDQQRAKGPRVEYTVWERPAPYVDCLKAELGKDPALAPDSITPLVGPPLPGPGNRPRGYAVARSNEYLIDVETFFSASNVRVYLLEQYSNGLPTGTRQTTVTKAIGACTPKA